jgi:REP element-mobilizing transposase RayT
MTRQPRIEFSGAFYHIITRGNQKQDIFIDDEDRLEYLRRLKRYKKEHGFIIYAYTLMTNHVHLLIETPQSPISKIMQVLNFTYTQHFNRKYDKVGHLFQGRYKSFLCDRDEYLLELVRYLHLNPVRAGMVDDPLEYRWSSHREYLSGDEDFIKTQMVLRQFSEKPPSAKELFEKFVNETTGKTKDNSFYRVVEQQILGDDRFIEEVGRNIAGPKKPLRRPSLEEIMTAVTNITGITEDEIISTSRNSDIMSARRVLVGVCREVGYKLVDLQAKVKRDLSVLSRWSKGPEIGQCRQRMEKVLESLNARMQA